MEDIRYETIYPEKQGGYGASFLNDMNIKDARPGMCFGTEAAKFADTLKEYISDELRDAEYYRILTKKADNGKKRQIIMNISNDEMHHARKLATAYFLSTGNYYFPNTESINERIPPFKLALRERFKEEYAAAAKYGKVAEETGDICLEELLSSMAKDEKRHALELQQMIEDSIIKI